MSNIGKYCIKSGIKTKNCSQRLCILSDASAAGLISGRAGLWPKWAFCTPIKYLIVLSDFQIFRKTVLDKYFFART